MKKIYALLGACALTSMLSAQSLVAYYPFTGDASDASGNGNNGTVNGPLLTTARSGVADNAYSFNGSGDNISVPDDPTLAFTDNYTIIAWVFATTAPGVSASPGGYSIASKDAGTGMNTPKWIFALQNGNLAYHINGPGLGNGEWAYSNSFSLTTGIWFYVAMSKSGNNVSFYVDGSPAGAATLTNSSVNPAAVLQLGNAEAGMGFYGALDEMKFYDYALTPAEIANDYAMALPVTLINFSAVANDDAVSLSWMTTQESNFAYFEVEKSTTSDSFTQLATVKAAGGPQLQHYSAYDHQPSNGTSYYRLKCVDQDGAFRYSKIVKASYNKNFAVHLFPNPAHDLLFIQTPVTIKSIRIIGIAGHIVRQYTRSPGSQYSIQGLSKGLYWVQLIADDQIEVRKLIVE